MPGTGQVLLMVIFFLIALISVSSFRRRQKKNTRIQAIRGVITGVGAVICFVSLFSTWIEYEGVVRTQLQIANIWNIALMQVVVYTMVFLTVLLYFGSFVYAFGFKAGKGLISRASSFFLAICVIFIIGLSIVPDVRFVGFAPWIAIFGAIIGRTSLEVPKEEDEEEEEPLKGECPKCGDPVSLDDSFCSNCGKALDLEDKISN